MLVCLTAPASATEWVMCNVAEGKVTFDMLLGSTDVIAVDTVNIEANGKKWSTKPEAGVIAISTGQAFDTWDQTWIDMIETESGVVIAKLRLFKARDETEGVEGTEAMAGVLHMPERGVWAVSCSGS
jgi:hypothetical protein